MEKEKEKERKRKRSYRERDWSLGSLNRKDLISSEWSTDPKKLNLVLQDKIGCFNVCPTISTNPRCTLGICSFYHGTRKPFGFAGKQHYCLAGKYSLPEEAEYLTQKIDIPRENVELAIRQGSVTGICIDPLKGDTEAPHPDWSMVSLNAGHTKEQHTAAIRIFRKDPKVLGITWLRHSFGLRCKSSDFRAVRAAYGPNNFPSQDKPAVAPAANPTPSFVQGTNIQELRAELKADIKRVEQAVSNSVNCLIANMEKNQNMALTQFNATMQSQNQMQNAIQTANPLPGIEPSSNSKPLLLTSACFYLLSLTFPCISCFSLLFLVSPCFSLFLLAFPCFSLLLLTFACFCLLLLASACDMA